MSLCGTCPRTRMISSALASGSATAVLVLAQVMRTKPKRFIPGPPPFEAQSPDHTPPRRPIQGPPHRSLRSTSRRRLADAAARDRSGYRRRSARRTPTRGRRWGSTTRGTSGSRGDQERRQRHPVRRARVLPPGGRNPAEARRAEYPLEEANRALIELKAMSIRGAKACGWPEPPARQGYRRPTGAMLRDHPRGRHRLGAAGAMGPPKGRRSRKKNAGASRIP